MTTLTGNHRHTDKTVETQDTCTLHILTMKPKGEGLDQPHFNLMTFRVDKLSEQSELEGITKKLGGARLTLIVCDYLW